MLEKQICFQGNYKPPRKFFASGLTKLSKYDISNSNFLQYESLRPSTSAAQNGYLTAYIQTNEECSNPLDMRKNLSKFKSCRDIMRIKSSLSRKTINIPLSKLNALLCPEFVSTNYNCAYLPAANGYGLVDRRKK